MRVGPEPRSGSLLLVDVVAVNLRCRRGRMPWVEKGPAVGPDGFPPVARPTTTFPLTAFALLSPVPWPLRSPRSRIRARGGPKIGDPSVRGHLRTSRLSFAESAAC